MIGKLLERRRCVLAVEASAEGVLQEGFTLIELLVVLLIMGILLAIAIPTFLGVTKGANDKAAQSDLTSALTQAQIYYEQNSQTYTGISSLGTSIQLVTGIGNATAATNKVYVAVGTTSAGQSIELETWSNSDVCWFVEYSYNPGGSTTFGPTTSGTHYAIEYHKKAADCTSPATTWTSTWTQPKAGY